MTGGGILSNCPRKLCPPNPVTHKTAESVKAISADFKIFQHLEPFTISNTRENVRNRRYQRHERRLSRQRMSGSPVLLIEKPRVLISSLQGATRRSNPYQPLDDFLSNVGRFKIIESTLRGRLPTPSPLGSYR
jgi:hypothetical protein